MNITSLAISGQCSSGKSTVSKLLAKKLGWNNVNIGNEFKRIAAEQGLPIEHFGSIPEKVLRAIDSQNEERIITERNVIWDGRLTCLSYTPHRLWSGQQGNNDQYCFLDILQS